MLDLKTAAKFARERTSARIASASNQKKGIPRSAAIVQKGASFRAQLIEACRRAGDDPKIPNPAPEALFLAFPERLFEKWYNLAFGPLRKPGDATQAPPPQADDWPNWVQFAKNTKFTNFVDQPRNVLIAHGLSAIEASILLWQT